MGSWKIVDRQSNVIDLRANGIHVLEWAGMGMPPVAHKVQAAPLTPGALFRGYKVQPRLVTLHQMLSEPDHLSYLGKRLLLSNIFRPDVVLDDTTPMFLRYTGGMRDLELEVQYDAGFELAGRIPSAEILAVRLIAYNPFLQELVDDGPFALTIGGTAVVTNNGTAAAWPIITLTGAGTVTQVKNDTTGHELNLDSLVLAAGEILTIDLRFFEKTFVTDVAGNVAGAVLPGSDVADFRLLPGSNTISVNAAAAASGDIKWRPYHWDLAAASL